MFSLTKGSKVETFVMATISQEQETKIDNRKPIIIKIGKTNLVVMPSNIECYGEIDFNNKSDDYNLINKFRWLDSVTIQGVPIPANYNYAKHCGYKELGYKYIQWFDSTSPAKVAQYAHGKLGKPERVVVFRIITNKKFDRYDREEVNA